LDNEKLATVFDEIKNSYYIRPLLLAAPHRLYSAPFAGICLTGWHTAIALLLIELSSCITRFAENGFKE
jgi:hypothetical protein